MFKPAPMQRVTVHTLKEDAPMAAMVLAERGVFSPETTPASPAFFRDHLPETPGEQYRESWLSARNRLDKILAHCGGSVEPPATAPLRLVTEEELVKLNTWLGETWNECSRQQEALRKIDEERKRVEQLFKTLDEFADLDVDLTLLQAGGRFLDIRVGTVPGANVPRLKQAIGLAGYMVSPFTGGDGTLHAIVAGPAGREEEIGSVLRAAGWHVLQIPPEFRDRPAKVRERLSERRARIAQDYESRRKSAGETCDTLRQRLSEAQQTLVLAGPFVDLVGEALRGRGGLASMRGWVPKEEVAALKEALASKLDSRFVLSSDDPRPDELHRVPSVMRHHRWLVPFSLLVKNYGVPRYGEVDPTLWFACTFIAMFGTMFGDVGQGGTIAALGLMFRRKLRSMAPFVVAAGLASTAFGWMYGSVFGFDDIIRPAWISPMSNPILMLTVALYWGIGFILVATLITIYNRLAQGHVAEALFDGKGVAGALFYLGLLYGGRHALTGNGFGVAEASTIAVPILAMLAFKWHKNDSPRGERILVVLIEGFETALNYFANTLSFLRVAAFSLNHVALALAVFTLAGMTGAAGHWITVVLGNIFIIVLEGAIVGIQALRLEYYEGFSRFFSGDGREFRPLRFHSHGAG